MASFARMYESFGPLLKGNQPGSAVDSHKPEPDKSSHKHQAPGRSSALSRGQSAKQAKSSDSSDNGSGDSIATKNSSISFHRDHRDHRDQSKTRNLIQHADTIGSEEMPSRQRPSSPRPVGSSRPGRDLVRSSGPYLRVPSTAGVSLDENVVGSRSPSTRSTAANDSDGQSERAISRKSYDSTDNMRLPDSRKTTGRGSRKDSYSSDDDSDTNYMRSAKEDVAPKRPNTESMKALSIQPLRTTSREQALDRPRESRGSVDNGRKKLKDSSEDSSDSAPLKSTSREIPFRAKGRDLPPQKGEGKPLSRDLTSKFGRNLSPTSRLNFRDDSPVQRRRGSNDSSDSTSEKVRAVKRQKDLKSTPGRSSSPTPRKPSPSIDPPARQRRGSNDGSDSPPLRSSSRDISLPRRQIPFGNRSRSPESKPRSDLTSARRRQDTDGHSDSTSSDETTPRRGALDAKEKNWSPIGRKANTRDEFNRKTDLDKSISPSPMNRKEASREEPFNARRNLKSATEIDDLPVPRRKRFEDPSDSPPLRSRLYDRKETENTPKRNQLLIKDGKELYGRSDSPTQKTDEIPVRRRRDLSTDGSHNSPPFDGPSPRRARNDLSMTKPLVASSSRSGDGLSPRRRNDQEVNNSLVNRSKPTSKYTDDSSDSPTFKSDEIPVRHRKDQSTAGGRTSPTRDSLSPRRRNDQEAKNAHLTRSKPPSKYTDDSSDSPTQMSFEIPARRKKDLNAGGRTSPPRDSLSPRRRNDLEVNNSLVTRSKPTSKYTDDSSDSPPRTSLNISAQRKKELDFGDRASPTRDSKTPRRQTDLDTSSSLRASPRFGSKEKVLLASKDTDESSESPPNKFDKISARGRSDLTAQRGNNAKPAPGRDIESSPRTGISKPSTNETKNSSKLGPNTRGDKDQPKSGSLKRSEPTVSREKEAPKKKKKSSDSSPSDSDSSPGRKGRKGSQKAGAEKPAIRLKLENNSGRSLSPPAKARLKLSPRDDAKGSKEVESGRKVSTQPSRDDLSMRSPKARDQSKTAKDDLSQRNTGSDEKSENFRPKDLPTRGSSNLSPRRFDKKIPAASPRAKSVTHDDATLGQKAGRIGKDLSPPRKGEKVEPPMRSPRTGLASTSPLKSALTEDFENKKDGIGFRLTQFGDKDNFRARAGPLNELTSRQTGFDFLKQNQKLNLIKLKKQLPANLSGTRYEIVQTAARHIGFFPSSEDDYKTPFLIWTDNFISAERLTQLQQFQRVNHFPGMSEISRKDLLAKNLAKLSKLHPGDYNFAPRTWSLPGELSQFQQYAMELQKTADKKLPPKSFICKPVNGASGKDIKIYKTVEEVPQKFEGEAVLQEYVLNPFLIDHVKFDLRLYVLVTSCDPLRVYFFNEGFIRMGTQPYLDPSKCKNEEEMPYIHLTNCSINKQSNANESATNRRRSNLGSGENLGGNKRSLRFLNDYLQRANYDVALVWRNIVDLILKTLFAAYPQMIRSYRQCRPNDNPGGGSVCFELLGFDILLDNKLKPWLIEVNRSPSLDYVLTAEHDLKLQLLEETLMLLAMNPSDRKRGVAAPASKISSGQTLKEQRELAELGALLAKLKQQEKLHESDTRICQRFRRIFPADDAARQEKMVGLLTSAFPTLLDTGCGPLQREVEAFYANKLTIDQVTQDLAKHSSVAFQQLQTSESQRAGVYGDLGSSSEEDEGRVGRSSRRLRLEGAGLKSGVKSGTLASKEPTVKKEKQRKNRQKQQQLQSTAVTNSDQYELLVNQTLNFLNHLSISFPGKSSIETERLLRDLQDNWQTRKADIGAYWRLSLDGDKRQKVIDIARQNVRFAVDKAFRVCGGGSATKAAEEASGSVRLLRLLDKLFNRLLWCNGQGLWDTFAGRTDWELIVRQVRDAPTEAEINCCRRVVQLCQDCLLVVFLNSTAAHQTLKVQHQQQATQQPVPVLS